MKKGIFSDPLSEKELTKILKLTGKKPSELIRKRDKMYKQLNLENNEKAEIEIIKLMVKYPGLIMRPITVEGKTAFVGKPNIK